VPWDAIAAQCEFPAEVIAIHELNMRFWRDRHQALDYGKGFLGKLKTKG
jgi:hypothetical protein